MPADRVAAVLSSREYEEAVRADIEEARNLGASGVPFFVLDRRYAVSGAQPTELFGEALRRAWTDQEARKASNRVR
jgi:predicted DsbA family dithiol-disulfide isomerase